MNRKGYVKTWKPFIAWMIGFSIISIIISLFLNVSDKISTLIMLLITVISIYILMLIIYKGEYVYWINGGPTYEEAKSEGSKRRKRYAKAHLDLFLKMTLGCLGYGFISLLFNFSMWLDIIIISGAIIVTALATIPIKF